LADLVPEKLQGFYRAPISHSDTLVNKVTQVSMGYPLSVFNKNSTLKKIFCAQLGHTINTRLDRPPYFPTVCSLHNIVRPRSRLNITRSAQQLHCYGWDEPRSRPVITFPGHILPHLGPSSTVSGPGLYHHQRLHQQPGRSPHWTCSTFGFNQSKNSNCASKASGSRHP